MTKVKKKLFSFGNKKLPKTTAIFNMGPFKTCPSLKLGLCQAMQGDKCVCYAKVSERLYPPVLPFRQRQARFWKKCVRNWDVQGFIDALYSERKLCNVKHLRLNECGDFYSQECVNFANQVAYTLYNRYGIVTYGYTARSDLKYTSLKSEWIRIMGSGFHKLGLYSEFRFVDTKEDVPKYSYVCKGDCNKCTMCLNVQYSVIYVVKHGRG